MVADEFLTAGKLAKEWGVPPKKVKDAIAKLGLQEDAKKGACKYYSSETAAKIKAALDD
jgi:hypothetical protein